MAAHCGFDVEVNFGQQKVAERLQQALGDFLERAPESQDAVAAILFCQSQMQAVAVQQLQEQMAEAPQATAPNQLWVADITYIDTQEGWLYVAGVLDLYSRKIVGWAMSERIDTSLVLKALDMALLHRTPPANVLFHSDRGVQYASGDFRQAIRQAGLVASMSRKGNCYDNAFMESFWSTLKLELVYRGLFQTRAQARAQIFDYIEVFYNRQRAHSALDFHSPVDFETLNH